MKFKKTMTSMLAVALSISVCIPQVYAVKFSDLRGYEWAEQYVNDVADKGIVSGYIDGTYKPSSPVTRIETLVMIANLHPKSDIDAIYKSNSAKYKDRLARYNIDEWARPYIVFALEKGIIPNSDKMLKSLINLETKNHVNALRYEASVFLVRSLGLENEMNSNAKLSYKDNKDILSQAVPYIELLQRKGIISKDGDGSGNFNPNKTITRAEIAIMLSKSYKYSAKAKGSSKPMPPTIKQENIRGKINLLTFDGAKL